MSSVGELTYFLRFQIKQVKDGIFVSQGKYATNIVNKFYRENVRHKHTLTTTDFKLTKDDQGVNVYQSLYMSMIGSLLYITNNHPNITFSMYLYACYQANTKMSHLTQVKRIIKYISGTYYYGPMYSFTLTLF